MRGWRAFYKRHPFGLLRGDLQAWLAGTASKFGVKQMPLADVAKMFDGLLLTAKERKAREKRQPKPKLPKPRITGSKLMALCQALGGTVVKDGGQ